ncbi:MAG: hypothetical protein WC279_06730 [Sulfurimonas sp.]|jgi:hypothetical protein|uniref:hypothetical protein n=1 Tax=Sulfurimonas sp. TaxID=2022749 RepID=UPI001BC2D62D|nr:hypothetical protein [Sulfurimonas sp.]MDX9756957.1 hypothetical protein [Sulfurimonas sp.]
MGRPALAEYDLKNKQIKINLTKSDLEKFNRRKNKLLEYSPTLSANDVLRLVVQNIDDLALIQFLKLDNRHPIKTMLLNDFLFTHTKNIKD